MLETELHNKIATLNILSIGLSALEACSFSKVESTSMSTTIKYIIMTNASRDDDYNLYICKTKKYIIDENGNDLTYIIAMVIFHEIGSDYKHVFRYMKDQNDDMKIGICTEYVHNKSHSFKPIENMKNKTLRNLQRIILTSIPEKSGRSIYKEHFSIYLSPESIEEGNNIQTYGHLNAANLLGDTK